MRGVRDFLRRHKLWLGFAAAFLPLLVLLVMQFSWLADLEKTSAIARKATLNNYVEGVLEKVGYFYWRNAERALNLPGALFTQSKLGKAAWYFRKKEITGYRLLFVVSYVENHKGDLLFFRPECGEMGPPEDEAEVKAIFVACAPWQLMAYKQARLESPSLVVDHKDPEHLMLLNPVTDDEARVVGVAGMIVDMQHFREVLLPEVVRKALPGFALDTSKHDMVVKILDPQDRVVFASGKVQEVNTEVKKYFPWIFDGYKVVLQSDYVTPEQWARSNFAVNVGLSALLAFLLLGGVVLALRTASREMKLSEMKTDFVSNVSHELRTPLASIRVFGEFMRLGRVGEAEKIREYGEYIESESRRLTQLINNILDFSKIESGMKTYHFEPTDLREIVKEVLRAFEVRLRHREFEIRYESPGDSFPILRLDPEALAQAFHNLLDNAVKYSRDSREIEVGLRLSDGGVLLSVRDYGVGISRDEQAKIFERFHRVGTGAVHNVRGSGLGLSIVHHIVQAHRGRVWVESEPGKGSRFSVFLPGQPDGATDSRAAAERERRAS